jgi:amino acid transporter
MKMAHRKTMWFHTAFSGVLCIILIALILSQRNLPTLVVGGLIAVYLIGNAYLHVKRGDFRRDTLYEYILLTLAVFVVIASATK